MVCNIIVDGSNVCARAGGQDFSIARLESAIAAVRADAPAANLRVFVDASLRWKISPSEQERLNLLINNDSVVQAPAGIPADDFILSEANASGAIVVSNDAFRQFHSMYPWLVDKRSGRLVGAVINESNRSWTFLERNPGVDPARSLSILATETNSGPHVPVIPTTVEEETRPRYRTRVTRNDPSAVVLLVDQSGSMKESWNDEGSSKAEQVAQVINSAINNLLLESKEGEVYKDYFDIAVVGYGGRENDQLRSMLPGTTLADPFLSLSEVAAGVPVSASVLPNGRTVRIRKLIQPVADGATPMKAALEYAKKVLEPWVREHPRSYPPTVINVTDGESTDGAVQAAASELCSLETDDGNVLLFIAHISRSEKPILFPSALGPDRDKHAHEMFKIASVLPAPVLATAKEKRIEVGPNARGFVFNASRDEVAQLINIGTMTFVLKSRE